jgi:hypothetical protein
MSLSKKEEGECLGRRCPAGSLSTVMSKALYRNLDSEEILDRDGYECGTRYEGYYLVFSDTGTVDCFEELWKANLADELSSPDAGGFWKREGDSVVISLNRISSEEKKPVPTMHDTYGPMEPTEAVFGSGTHRMEIVFGGLHWIERGLVFSHKDGPDMFPTDD